MLLRESALGLPPEVSAAPHPGADPNMSVRGTSHAMAHKKVINHDRGGTFVCCAWDECDRDGFELYKIRQHAHASTIPCDSSLATHVNFIFCSEKHRMYWISCSGERAHELAARYNGRQMGMLPPGYRNRDNVQ